VKKKLVMATQNCQIETYLRVRPRLKGKENIEFASKQVSLDNTTPMKPSNDNSIIQETRGIIDLAIPMDAHPGLIHANSSGVVSFEFDQVFDENVNQETVFDSIAREKIINLLQGENSTIFAYGQTGSGKTYNIFGGDSFQDRGIIPRAIGLVFSKIQTKQNNNNNKNSNNDNNDNSGNDNDMKFKITARISFTEVYGENVYDLLDPQKRYLEMEQWSPIQILETPDVGLVLRNLNVYEVTSEEDALGLFFMGNTNRVTSATPMNEASSRSHAIFTIMIENNITKSDGEVVLCHGKLNLVDLAGSERIYKKNNTRDLRQEGKNINLSLHFLEQVIVNLREKAKKLNNNNDRLSIGSNNSNNTGNYSSNNHIPYRNSVLTSILRDSLGGNCRSAFLLTISLERNCFDESISTCRFGQRCGEVKVKVKANTEIDPYAKINSLKAQNATLLIQREELQTEVNRLTHIIQGHRQLNEHERRLCFNIVTNLLHKRSFNNNDNYSNNNNNSITEFSDSLHQLDRSMLLHLCEALGSLLHKNIMYNNNSINGNNNSSNARVSDLVTVYNNNDNDDNDIGTEVDMTGGDDGNDGDPRAGVGTGARGKMEGSAIGFEAKGHYYDQISSNGNNGKSINNSPDRSNTSIHTDSNRNIPDRPVMNNNNNNNDNNNNNNNYYNSSNNSSSAHKVLSPESMSSALSGGPLDISNSYSNSNSNSYRVDISTTPNVTNSGNYTGGSQSQSTYTSTGDRTNTSQLSLSPVALGIGAELQMPLPLSNMAINNGTNTTTTTVPQYDRGQSRNNSDDYERNLTDSILTSFTPLVGGKDNNYNHEFNNNYNYNNNTSNTNNTNINTSSADAPSKSGIPGLTQQQHEMLCRGAKFLKHGRYSTKQSRHVSVSPTLDSISWRSLKSNQAQSLPFNTFQSVTTSVQGKKDRQLVGLVGKPGFRSLFLDYTNEEDTAINREMAIKWTTALALCVKYQNNKGGTPGVIE